MSQQGTKYVKLGDYDGKNFTVMQYLTHEYVNWQQRDENGRPMKSEEPRQGYKKFYKVEIAEGILSLSEWQMGQMLNGVASAGIADINGKTFTVKKVVNGERISYFINPVKTEDVQKEEPKDDVNIEELPF